MYLKMNPIRKRLSLLEKRNPSSATIPQIRHHFFFPIINYHFDVTVTRLAQELNSSIASFALLIASS